MEKKTLISVIIPVYNGEKYLTQCIENILCQTYKDIELIVVDDGSTDNSATVAEQYPVKLIRQENQGVSTARNVGIAAATGEYLHFMDVDDSVNLNFYEKMLETALATDADMVCCEVVHERLPSLSLFFNDKLVVTDPEDKMTLTNVGNHGFCFKYLFRVGFLNDSRLRFEKELCHSEDLVLTMQAVYFSNKIVSVPHAVYYYKHRADSAVTTKNKRRKIKKRESIKKANCFCAEFARQHNLKVLSALEQKVQYKILGIPVLKKVTYSIGKIRWYLFGVYVMQKKRYTNV